MPTYQLQIRQVVDYPRCRIYWQFVRFLMEDRSIRVGGGSGLFCGTFDCHALQVRSLFGLLPERFTSPRARATLAAFWPYCSVREQAGHHF